MDKKVNYTVTATDLLTPKLEGMNASAHKVEGSLAGIAHAGKSAFSGLMSGLGTLGVGFAAFKGFELMHEGVEAVERYHQAQAQVVAGLESTAFAAGITAEEMQKMQKEFSAVTKYGKADIAELQSVMVTFPAIIKDTFPQATETILNMSTRLGQDTKSSAIQLGKALQDPIRGITALRRVGVNFNDTQVDTIKKLVETGQTAKAQTMILAELQTEFGNSARTAFDTDPLAKYNKMMASMKMAMGEAGLAILETIQPALLILGEGVKMVAEGFKEVIHWAEENKDILEALAVGIGTATVAWGIYTVATSWAAIVMGVTNIAANLLSASLFILENVMTFGIPIAIAAVTAALYYAYGHFAKFRAVVDGTWSALKTFGTMVGTFFKGLGNTIAGAFMGDPEQMAKGIAQMSTAFQNGGKKIGDSFNKGYDESMADFAKKNADKKEGKKQGLLTPHSVGGNIAAAKEKKEKGGNGSGKPVTINIHIGSLIHDFKISTQNIHESSKAIHDKVVTALTAAVNDSQLISGN